MNETMNHNGAGPKWGSRPVPKTSRVLLASARPVRDKDGKIITVEGFFPNRKH